MTIKQAKVLADDIRKHNSLAIIMEWTPFDETHLNTLADFLGPECKHFNSARWLRYIETGKDTRK